jgi:hypothetical protein
LSALLLASPVARAADVDTQFIFGFTAGADTGQAGEKELEWQTLARIGKANGRYAAYTGQLRIEYAPWRDFRFEAGLFADYHAIAAVSGFEARDSLQFGGFVAETRWRVLDRRSAPLGLTLSVEPHWARIDDLTGAAISNWGNEFLVALDKELVASRVFAAINVIYDPEWTQFNIDGSWRKQSTLAFSAALTGQVDNGIFIGIEAHHLLSYDGTGLDNFSGQALFLGPTAYVLLSDNLAVSAAWSFQVAGGAVDLSGPLNLRDFERYQARVRFEYTF